MKKIVLTISSIILLSHNLIYPASVPAELENLGATCYMNSTLQCLYQIEPLTNFLLKEGPNFYKPGTIAMEYIDFIKKIPQKSGSVEFQRITEPEMGELCYPVFKKFFAGSSGQQDASEFLQQFLDRLADEDVKNEKRGKEFITGTSTKKNPVSNLFFSLIKSKITPTILTATCQSSIKTDGASKLDLEIKAKNPDKVWENLNEYDNFSNSKEGVELKYKTLQKCLEVFTSSELLEEKYRCLDDTLVEAKKRLHFQETAPFLIIVLKRFSSIKIPGEEKPVSVPVKESHAVSFPVHALDLKPYMSKDAKQTKTKYDLISFVEHGGAAGGGHYTSYVKAKDQWFYCNDTHISPRSKKDIESIADKGIDGSFTPYILFYKRQDVLSEEETIKQSRDALSLLETQLQTLAQKAITAK